MYTLKIVDGDLAMMGDGMIAQLSGANRIEQELACWLLEPLGTDAMYGNFGSTLGESIGMPLTPDALLDVRAEVTRIVNNYVAYQRKQYEEARNTSNSAVVNAWKEDDLIAKIDYVRVDSMADTAMVVVKLTTASGAGVSIEQVL